MLSHTQRVFVAIGGITIILGNLFFLLVPGGTDLLDVRGNIIGTGIVVTVGVFLWGGGLMGIFLPFIDIDYEKATATEKKAGWVRLSFAFNIGAILAWSSLVPYEHSLVLQQAQGRGSILTGLFFATWSFAGAIGMVQLMPKLPRFKLTLARV